MKFEFENNPFGKEMYLSTIIGTKLICTKSHEIGITEGKIYPVINDMELYGIIKNDEDKEIPACMSYFDIYEEAPSE